MVRGSAPDTPARFSPRSPLRSLRVVVRSAAIWAGVAGVVLVGVPPMMLGYPLVVIDPNRALSDWYLRKIGRALVRVNPMWSVRVVGKEKLLRGGPFVLVVNHQSFADLIAMCFLDHPTKYLGKASVFDVPVLGWAMRIAGEVPVVRGDKKSGHDALERLGEWLDRGVSVALFPEGTRSETGEIGNFKLGAFHLAIMHKRPVVPIVLKGAGEVLPKRSVLFEKEAEIEVNVLDPISTANFADEDTPKLAELVREKMIEALGTAHGGRT
jgi:1-acyl-sn-glycerol-3-phosphate acyltransferase